MPPQKNTNALASAHAQFVKEGVHIASGFVKGKVWIILAIAWIEVNRLAEAATGSKDIQALVVALQDDLVRVCFVNNHLAGISRIARFQDHRLRK